MKQNKVSKDEQIKKLQREKMELLAQLLCSQDMAHRNIPKAAGVKASAVIVTITALGGQVICEPFAVADGLSVETVKCLQADIKRSMDLQLEYTGKYKDRLETQHE